MHHICRRGLCAALAAWTLTCEAGAVGTSASSALLIEQESGRVLYAQNADEERLIASITKIMTAVVALEHGSPDMLYTVTAEDMAEGSSMYLKPGDQLRLEELLYGLMLVSGNDAALAVAHCVSGSVEEFVDLMNETAKRLNMDHTHFANPNGLDAQGHYSSARDMAVLAAYALKNQDFKRIVSTTTVTIGERYLTNHNKLLRRCEGCIGVKTGFTKAAGRTLVSAAARGGRLERPHVPAGLWLRLLPHGDGGSGGPDGGLGAGAGRDCALGPPGGGVGSALSPEGGGAAPDHGPYAGVGGRAGGPGPGGGGAVRLPGRGGSGKSAPGGRRALRGYDKPAPVL